MENKSANVLVVDDMAINRSILSTMLSSHNVHSDQAESAAECIECCRKNNYDLILLDHRMPDVDGVDTLVHLKELFRRNGVDIPVICHTAESAKENINLYKAAGFADVLFKPVDPDELTRILETYLSENAKSTVIFNNETKDIDKQLSLLPNWIKTIPKLDLKNGIEHCGDAEDYLNSLEIFVSSVNSKAEEIDGFCKDRNWSMYSLRVHSLKSMAGLIGAKQLSDEAAKLEYLSRQGDVHDLPKLTREMLDDYRSFSHIAEYFKKPAEEPVAETADEGSDEEKRTILFVEGSRGMVNKGIINKLKEVGFEIICVDDDPAQILEHRHDADLWLYYAAGNTENIRMVSSHLTELCEDDNRILCIVGDPLDIAEAKKVHNSERIRKEYVRPVDMTLFVNDMLALSDMQHELNRTKTVFLIDDDPDFLSITERWLKIKYRVKTFRSGQEAIFYMNSTVPDLILLDYIMPGMDGFETMQKIRLNPKSHDVPIVFLTGQSDKNDVLKILEKKPDGYILKSMPKLELLRSIETIFNDLLLKDSTIS